MENRLKINNFTHRSFRLIFDFLNREWGSDNIQRDIRLHFFLKLRKTPIFSVNKLHIKEIKIDLNLLQNIKDTEKFLQMDEFCHSCIGMLYLLKHFAREQ